MGKTIELKKTCISCGQKKAIFGADHCQECLDYFHDQWKVIYYKTEIEMQKNGAKAITTY